MTRQERSWVLYDWANSAYSIIITTAIFPIFFKNVAAAGVPGYLSTAWWGYANSLYTLLLALIAPILGTIADYQARKMKFFLAFFLLGIIATLGLYFIGQGEWIKAILIYMGSALGFSGANIFYDAFLVDVTTEERMDWISTSGYGWGYIGSTIPFALCLILIAAHESIGFQSSVPAVRISFLITGSWWLIFTIPFFRHVRQIHFVPASQSPVRDSFRRLGETFRSLRQYRNLALFLAAYFFYIDGVDTIIKMATPIAIDVGIGESTLLIILMVIQIVAFPFALIYGWLARRFSAKIMLFAGIGIYVVITLLAFFLPYLGSQEAKTTLFWVLSMFVASSQGGIQALSRSLYGKLIPKERSAEFFGFYNIFGKFAAIMGPLLVAFLGGVMRNAAFGILSINLLFVIGGILLFFVQQKEE